MSLTFIPLTSAPASGPVRLPDDMLDTVREYAAAKKAKSDADKAGRNADNVMKSTRAKIMDMLNGSKTGLCGHAVLTVKDTKESVKTITLTDGSTIEWSRVTGLTVGNQYIDANSVAGIYGGRSGFATLDVTGV